jgi:hypothetical protein
MDNRLLCMTNNVKNTSLGRINTAPEKFIAFRFGCLIMNDMFSYRYRLRYGIGLDLSFIISYRLFMNAYFYA